MCHCEERFLRRSNPLDIKKIASPKKQARNDKTCTRLIAGAISLLLFIAHPVWAKSQPTLSDRVNTENAFNKVTDYFASLGKSDVNKAALKRERHEQRRRNRLRSLQQKKEQAEMRRLENEK